MIPAELYAQEASELHRRSQARLPTKETAKRNSRNRRSKTNPMLDNLVDITDFQNLSGIIILQGIC